MKCVLIVLACVLLLLKVGSIIIFESVSHRHSPDGKYNVYVIDSSFRIFTYDVYLYRWYYLLPTMY